VTARRLTLLALAAAVAIVVFAAATRMTAASFTASLETGGNAVTVDRLSNHFSVAPGPDAVGGVDELAIDLGLLDRPQVVSGVFTVTNVGSSARTATLAFVGPQVAAATFASSGTASATLAPGASSSVTLTTSAAKADEVAGTLRLRLGGSTWLYRDYSVTFEAAPAVPATLTATPKPAADIELSWPASATTDGLAGYDVYRSTGGSWTKRNTTPVADTSWLDTSSTNGTQYSYRVRAVSIGGLQSIDSSTATARADSSAPTRPSAVALANGGGTGNAYLNPANSGSVSVRVTLGASSVSTDVVTVTLSRSGVSVSATAPATQGAGTLTLSGIDASALPDGSVTISATAADAAGNVSSARTTTATKDTVAPGAPTASYTDRTGSQTDRITGTAEGSSTITATRTVPSAAGPYTATAASGGTYTVNVAAQAGSPGSPVTVTYLVTATDAAGNVSAITILTYAVTR
jgi:hypothetical protein